jgi:hypothetical protein
MEINSSSLSREGDGLPTAENPGLDVLNGIHIKTKETHCLSEHERKILQDQVDVPEVKITYMTLYRYATAVDLAIMALSSL